MDPIIIAVIVIVLAIGGWAIKTTNDFKRMDIDCAQAQSGIFVALEMRYDVLTKMLDVAKGYMKHENDLFGRIVELRENMDVEQLSFADRQMNELQALLMARAEAYPDMKSSEVFQRLQVSIEDVETNLQAVRRIYNNAVGTYNKAIVVFPNSLLAGNRMPKDFFELSDQKKQHDVVMDLTM